MSDRTLTEKLTKSENGMRLYQQERAILEITETLCRLMHEQGFTRTKLAHRLGKTKGYITQLLDGRTNMTIRTISDAFVAIGHALHFQEGPLDRTVSQSPCFTFRAGWNATESAWRPGVVVVPHRDKNEVIEKLAS